MSDQYAARADGHAAGLSPRPSRITTPATRGRDHCNVDYLCATMLGATVLALNLHDAKAATNVVSDMPFVDAKRLGVMGVSRGGCIGCS